jgi:hypothetical protein
MDPIALAGMIFTLLLVLIIGGFILLFPLSRRLGLFLEAKLKPAALASEDTRKLWEAIQSMETELKRIADRQEFTERMLTERAATSLPRRDPGALPPAG